MQSLPASAMFRRRVRSTDVQGVMSRPQHCTDLPKRARPEPLAVLMNDGEPGSD